MRARARASFRPASHRSKVADLKISRTGQCKPQDTYCQLWLTWLPRCVFSLAWRVGTWRSDVPPRSPKHLIAKLFLACLQSIGEAKKFRGQQWGQLRRHKNRTRSQSKACCHCSVAAASTTTIVRGRSSTFADVLLDRVALQIAGPSATILAHGGSRACVGSQRFLGATLGATVPPPTPVAPKHITKRA